MMKLKNASVIVDGLSPQVYFAIGVAARLFRDFEHDLIITSAKDGHHNPGSLHPKGQAIDIRVINLEEHEREPIFDELKSDLERYGFDVIWEGAAGATPATTGAHIHIEYDPKPGERFWRLAE